MISKDVGAACRRCLLVLLLTAIAAPDLAQAADPGTPAAAPSSASAAVPAVSAVSPDYKIGPGDMLQVFVWRNPELTVTVPVRPDGKISTPLVSDLSAVGKTPSQLATDIEHVLSEYVRSPTVNVIVTQPISTYSQVKVVGQVTKPSAIPYRDGLTVLDVMLQAGGLGQFAAGNRARIMRVVNGKTTEIRVRLLDLLNKGDMKQNIALKPGDVLVVPESLF